MRLDKFADEEGIAMTVVDQFDKFSVEVALPPDWETFRSPPGTRAYIWRADPLRHLFGANVVLTMTELAAVLDPAEVFAMLCEWQVHLLPGTHEIARDVVHAVEGPGVVGTLALQINSDKGILDCVSLARILEAEKRTLIAQATMTALPDSPVDRAHIGLSVRPITSADTSTTLHPGAATPLYPNSATAVRGTGY